MTYLKFDIKLSLFLTTTFILMTVVGTLTHELGHYSVARFLGYEASINYASSSYWNTELNEFLSETNRQYLHEIRNDLDFPNKEKYLKIVEKYKADSFWITLGGPIQTMLTGTIGLILLISFRKKIFNTGNIGILGWGLIFMTLLWLRQLANLFMVVTKYFSRGQSSIRGDEMRLALYLDINIWTIQVITGMVGLGVLLFVIISLPKKYLVTFMISGLVGGTLGYYLWLVKFGPIIIP